MGACNVDVACCGSDPANLCGVDVHTPERDGFMNMS